jgi:uncharacterized protein with von Willebrand factor type A (vWA) domain
MTPAMPRINTLQELLGRASREQIIKRELPRSVVSHDSIDEMEWRDGIAESPRFRRMTIESPPLVPPMIDDPDPIDFTQATPDEIKAWQEQAREAKRAHEEAPPYAGWEDLDRDLFYSYHSHDKPDLVDQVDPGVELHKRILPRLMVTDEHAESRNITRDDPTMARMATMAASQRLKEVAEEEMLAQIREAQEFEEQRQQAGEAQQSLEGLREEAKAHHEQGEPIPQPLVEAIKAAVAERQQALAQAQTIAESPTPLTPAAAEGVAQAAQAGQEAAETAKNLPNFGSGLGEGEPVYASPEQAISIAERWANEPDLRAMCELFGRLDKDIRFKRSKRVVGGQEEIVDISVGDNLARVIPSELALLGDDDFEDDFLSRFTSGELLEFSTVGEEHAGRGPCVMVMDGSGSMHGERNVFARAIAMCLLHICRLEKRDFALIEFSGGNQIAEWHFEANKPLDGEGVIDMCSHFFGGGTTPIIGVTRAAALMREAAPFRKADVIMVGDGEAGFGPEDEHLRNQLNELGVRIFAIGIGGSFRYLQSYCEPDGYLVDVHDFDLTDPNLATAELATHVT